MLGLDLTRVSASPAWWSEGANFAADFVNDRYMRNGLSISRSDALSVTRATPKLAVDSRGHWHTFPANTLARTDLGALVEPAATNYVHNSAMVGAIPGTPGTAPTGWTIPTNSNGLARQIVATGIVDGLPYIDVRFFGTTTAESFLNLYLCPVHIPTLPGDSWSLSCNIALIVGTLSGLIPALACRLRAAMLNESASYIGELMTDPSITFGGGTVVQVQTANVANSNCRYLSPYLQFWYSSGATIDFTMRLAAPQLESIGATSPKLTTGAAATRPQDDISLNLASLGQLIATYSDGSSSTHEADTTPASLPTTRGRRSIRFVEAFDP